MLRKVSSYQALTHIIIVNLLVILLAILWGIAKGEPSMKFQEYGFITTFSSIQLLFIAVVCYLSYRKRKTAIWMLATAGFIVLAVDDSFLIHENMDFWIHSIFRLKETTFSDKIDDFLILAYGLTGLILMYKYRIEFLANKTGILLLGLGFGFMVMMVIIDTISNDSNVIQDFFNNLNPDSILHLGVILEESCKIIAEAFLLAGFYAYQTEATSKYS